ncbi:MAG: DUF5020 family protein [Flavobacteriales bacterium]|nr:DUF5020 family protein [Flavobacteriales bacterium]
MKNITLLLTTLVITLLSSINVKAQNLQLHYDFGEGRDFVTSTFEYGKFTETSNTFMFLDMDYSRTDGAGLAYWEISHDFKFNSLVEGIGLHIEYNDGLLLGEPSADYGWRGWPINRAYLLGVSYPIKIGNFTLNTHVSAKYFEGYSQASVDAQITVVWFQMFWDGKITFTGFADLWSQDLKNNGTKYGVFLCEPQLWYNINSSISVGSEVELSKNFIPADNGEFKARPTIAVKWNI